MKSNLYHHFMALIFLIIAVPAWTLVSQEDIRASENQTNVENKQKVLTKVYALRIPFIANEGQVAKEVGFYAKIFGGAVYVTREGEMVYSLTKKEQDQASAKGNKHKKDPNVRVYVLKERLLQAKKICPVGVEKSLTKFNYFIGSNKDRWKTNIPGYNSVSLGEVYDYIDLALRAHGNNVEKIFTVHPKGRVEDIRFAIEGALSLAVSPEGELEVGTGSGTINFSGPIAFQKIEGKQRKVRVAYAVKNKTYGFKVGDYDRKFPLIIDPTLSYSTYLGGNNWDDGYGIAVDSNGNAYVTGITSSTNFPVQNPFDGTLDGSIDAFVTKLTSSGNALSYSTYIGGSDDDESWGIAVDSNGNAYVTGITSSTNFPVQNPFDGTLNGVGDAFITKLDSSGSVSYSTYLGGNGYDAGWGIAVDSNGNAYVIGDTESSDFPTQNPYNSILNGSIDAFVTKLTSSGNALSYSTFLGGANDDWGNGIAVDSNGNAYVTGYTESSDFPTQNPYDSTLNGSRDAFVTKLISSGNALFYSTYLGGSNDDESWGIAVDSNGNTYVMGDTKSSDFPTQNPYDSMLGGIRDVFVTKLTSSGNTLSYSTFLGGANDDWGNGIAVDSNGNAYVTGYTESSDFPTQNPYDSTLDGAGNAFVTKLISSGNALSYSTYLGGSDDDESWGIAVDSDGNAYVTGTTFSGDFPSQNPYQCIHGGGWGDAFVTKIDLTEPQAKAMPWIPLLLLDD